MVQGSMQIAGDVYKRQRFASCDKAHGVNIVFDGKVIAGTRGKKMRTKSYNAFSSINFPYIATVSYTHLPSRPYIFIKNVRSSGPEIS